MIPVVAQIITYERRPLALQTIRSVKEHVAYPHLEFHISDDGSRTGHVDALIAEIGNDYKVTVTNSARKGVGTSMNFGAREILKRADLILHLEDDWVIPEGILELQPFVDLLVKEPSIGMVRLGLLTLDMQGTTVHLNGRVWWKLNKGPPYTFNGHPSLRHRRFYEAYGPYKEGLKPGETEVAMCWQFNNLPGPSIVIPPCVSAFQHIGDSQSFKYFMEREGLSGEQAAARFIAMDEAANVRA
jgi:hypothetical protein